MFRNRFLSSVAHFYGPADKPGEGDADTSQGDDTNDDTSQGDDNDEGDDTNDEGDDSSDGEEGDGDDSSDEGGEGKGEGDDEPSAKEDWRDKQLAKQHRKLQEERRQRQMLEHENATLKALAEGREPPKKPAEGKGGEIVVSKEEAVRLAKEELTATQQRDKFDADCNATYADGKGRFKNWDSLLKRLPTLGGVDDDTMQFVLATDDPAQALYAMASDPDEYERVMELPMAKRATALAKIGAKKTPEKKRPSNAPNPVTPLKGSNTTSKRRFSTSDPASDKLSDEEWYANRDRERAERRKKQGR